MGLFKELWKDEFMFFFFYFEARKIKIYHLIIMSMLMCDILNIFFLNFIMNKIVKILPKVKSNYFLNIPKKKKSTQNLNYLKKKKLTPLSNSALNSYPVKVSSALESFYLPH